MEEEQQMLYGIRYMALNINELMQKETRGYLDVACCNCSAG